MKISRSALFLLTLALFFIPGLALASNAGDFAGGVAIGTGYAGVNTAPTNGMIVQGNVGIGTTTASNPVVANGVVQSLSGGFKFPDGTTQTTAATGGGSGAVPPGFSALNVVWNSNTTFTISANTLTVNNSTPASTLLTSVSQQCNSATSGAGGLDTGTLAASTWYYDYVIYGTSGTACLFSTSSSSPTLPSGYTYYARTGAVDTDASKHFVGFSQYGRHWQYSVGNNLSGEPLLWSGTEGSITTPTYVSLTAPVPTTASVIYIEGFPTSSTMPDGYIIAPNGNYGAYNSTSNPPACSQGVNAQNYLCTLQMETAQTVYVASQANANGYVLAFDDNL
jgi:hypothetical protein